MWLITWQTIPFNFNDSWTFPQFPQTRLNLMTVGYSTGVFVGVGVGVNYRVIINVKRWDLYVHKASHNNRKASHNPPMNWIGVFSYFL